MPYPEIDTRRILDGTAAQVARRPLDPIELDLRAKVQAVLDALEAVRAVPAVFDAGSDGADALRGLLIDGPHYCLQVLMAVNAIPEQEAQAEESWRNDEMKWETV